MLDERKATLPSGEVDVAGMRDLHWHGNEPDFGVALLRWGSRIGIVSLEGKKARLVLLLATAATLLLWVSAALAHDPL